MAMMSAPRAMPRVMVSAGKPPPSMPTGTRTRTIVLLEPDGEEDVLTAGFLDSLVMHLSGKKGTNCRRTGGSMHETADGNVDGRDLAWAERLPCCAHLRRSRSARCG